MMIAIVVILAFVLDYIFGEPKRYHPLIGFGSLASRCERICNRFYELPQYRFISFILGLSSWLLLVLIPTVSITLLVAIPDSILFLFFAETVVLTLAIAQTSLKQHGLAILTPLLVGDVVTARQELAKIVSRDTQNLQELAVRQATIESILENGSDAIFAPVFWYVVGGLPAIIIYRLSNTLDAMWGYKTLRFNYFGRFAARMDDILNYVPSRLVALSYALLGATRSSLHCWFKQAHRLESPNAGVVMTAGAGALELTLGGPSHYHGEIKHKPEFGCGQLPENNDISRSLRLVSRTAMLWCLLLFVVGFLTAFSSGVFNSKVFNSRVANNAVNGTHNIILNTSLFTLSPKGDVNVS
ncbi:MAG: adenosylcobinamide-phosphate synthase CbiB [Cellvibrionaceae bacterium]